MFQPSIERPTDLTQPGAIDQLIAYHRQMFGGWRMEVDPTDPPADPPADPADPPADPDDLGYPKDTPVSEMTDAQARRYFEDKAKKEEKRRKGLSTAVGGKTAEQIQADMAELEELRKKTRSEGENAVEDAKAAVRKEERQKAAQRIATSTLRSALSHVEDKKVRDELIDGIKTERFIDDDGEVDEDKLREFAKKLAPVGTTTTPRTRNFGGGQRTHSTTKVSTKTGGEGGEGSEKPRVWGK